MILVIGEYSELIPHCLAHYRELGISRFLIHLHAASLKDDALGRADSAARSVGASIASLTVGPWFPGITVTYFSGYRHLRPNDWFVLADPDEFQIYPNGILDTVAYCERNHFDYIEGCLIDRIAANGDLNEVLPNTPIWQQYPLAGMLTAVLCNGVVNKIVAAKGHVRLGNGQHVGLSGKRCPVKDCYIPVHHFKWTRMLRDRLNTWIPNSLLHGRYDAEFDRVRAYFSTHPRIQVDDSSLMIAPSEKTYSHWNRILEWRSSAKHFTTAVD